MFVSVSNADSSEENHSFLLRPRWLTCMLNLLNMLTPVRLNYLYFSSLKLELLTQFPASMTKNMFIY